MWYDIGMLKIKSQPENWLLEIFLVKLIVVNKTKQH
jgi:hypothetical protein